MIQAMSAPRPAKIPVFCLIEWPADREEVAAAALTVAAEDRAADVVLEGVVEDVAIEMEVDVGTGVEELELERLEVEDAVTVPTTAAAPTDIGETVLFPF